jgi:hypothetical protein
MIGMFNGSHVFENYSNLKKIEIIKCCISEINVLGGKILYL